MGGGGAQKARLREIKRRAVQVPAMDSMPGSIDPVAFARARAAEIQLIKDEISTSERSGMRRVFQTLPRTMRRRAASFHIKRLPARLRQRALDQLNKDPTTAPKKIKKPPCRRRRRRPQNIQREFGRRSNTPNALWLATHMFHAKRCKMDSVFGHKIAVKMNEKCRKASVRAAIEGCFLCDTSYYQLLPCSEGCISQLRSYDSSFDLSLILSTRTIVIPGLGPIQFIREESSIDDHKSSLYMLVHPLLAEQLIASFNGMDVDTGSRESDVDQPKDISDDDVRSSFQTVSIFELQGSASLAILQRVLQCGDILNSVSSTSNSADGSNMWLQFLDAPDPRLLNPELSANIPVHASMSRIVGFTGSTEIPSEQQLNELRSQLVLPGSPLNMDTRIPLCVICDVLTLKLIVPHAWAMTIWRALVSVGHRKPGVHDASKLSTRVGALAERRHVMLERGIPSFPEDYPHTMAYLKDRQRILNERSAKWQRTPPSKRTNYTKLDIADPFVVDPEMGQPASSIIRVRLAAVKRGIPCDESLIYLQRDDGFDVIGKVTSGDYSQIAGCGVGFGIVDLNLCSMDELLQSGNRIFFALHDGPKRPLSIQLLYCEK